VNKVSILARIIVVSLILNGCSSVSYLTHTTSGHLELMSKRQKIEQALEDENISTETKIELQRALKIRAFASNELALPDNNSYLSFVSLERDYVTWVVFASAEYSLDPVSWCFLIVGCIPYRGYFSEDKAQEFSLTMLDQGYEIYIAPVPAYSTLGWFDDPLLSTMLNQGETVTANYIFHELAHQQIYISGDPGFNEAFASAVADLGVIRWLQAEHDSEALRAYRRRLEIKKQVYEYTHAFRVRLKEIYAADNVPDTMQAQKSDAFMNYKAGIKQLVSQHGGSKKYSDWLLKDLNNAKLGAMATYQELVPAFKSLFERCDNNFELFYQVVASMKALDNEQRRLQIDSNDCTQTKRANF
jgi:predicted aminopeptidase